MALTVLKSITAAATSLAVLSLAASPALAAELPQPVTFTGHVYHADAILPGHDGDHWYGRGGWDGGWRGDDDDIDAGGVIAGILLLGGIAAVASAASHSSHDNATYRNSDYQPRRERYRDNDSSSYYDQGMARAVDMCTRQVERGRYQIDGVDHAERNADGWFVSGTVRDGRDFTCHIGNDGRLQNIDIGSGDHQSHADRYSESAREDRQGEAPGQLSNEAYARARARVGSPSQDYLAARNGSAVSAGQGERPSYPGGPVPGEAGYAAPDPAPPQQASNSASANDGRYTTAQSPDFSQTS